MVHHLLYPTPSLQKLLSNNPHHAWGKPLLWEVEHFWTIPRGEPYDAEILAKALHLVAIAKIESPDALTHNLRSVMFGDPPQYIISTFDRWWTIKPARSHWSADETLEQAKSEHYAAIEKTGYAVIDNWLSSMSDLTRYSMMNLLRSKTERTFYIRYPTPDLLELVGESPSNLWTMDTILYLSSRVMSLQEQYTIPLIKILYLVHLALHGNPYSTQSIWMATMFGNPSRYNIENFDRWWTIEPLKCIGNMEQIRDDYPHDKALQRAFTRIELTGHEGTDN
jgi:hypothetical protein